MADHMPRKRAIALEYDGETAPRITALGQDALAERIAAVALAHGVPMVENNELATLLGQLDLGDQIPETLYLCVAQIIAFAYTLRGKTPMGWEDPNVTPGDWIDPAEDPPFALLSADPHGGQA